jgi:hypothetical protein
MRRSLLSLMLALVSGMMAVLLSYAAYAPFKAEVALLLICFYSPFNSVLIVANF